MTDPLALLNLQAFSEAGRLGSFKAAATALGVTPSAVSQRIKQLEEQLGVPLFERSARKVRLTTEGARFHAAITRAFSSMEHAVEELADRNQRISLTVSTMPSFAASWLVPRLGRFTEQHPDIEVRVEATPTPVKLKRDGVDVAIRHGLGKYPGLKSWKLVTPVLQPVASPALLKKGQAIERPEDCVAYPLLHDGDRKDWGLWLRAHGCEDDRTVHGSSYEDDFLLLKAAVAGQGIALVRDIYAAEELEAGRLQIAYDAPWPTSFAYYLVTTPEAARSHKVAAFMKWALAEAATEKRQ